MFLRNLLVIFLFVCLSTPVFSQAPATSQAPMRHGLGMHARGMASDEQIDRALMTLQRTLNLTSSQSADIRRLVQSRRADFRAVREQTRAKFEQLMNLLNQPNPDPASVGRATMELKAIHDQALSKQADMEAQLTNVLNPEQRRIVNNLRDQAETFYALRSVGLLPATGYGRGMQRGTSQTSGGEDSEF